jgi:hypothetical protein
MLISMITLRCNVFGAMQMPLPMHDRKISNYLSAILLNTACWYNNFKIISWRRGIVMFKTTVNLIQVLWEGPYHFNDLNKLTNLETDYGLYQIYGYHPVYGKSVLLYIGKADQQTFGKRISQETWKDVNDSNNDQIYVGRLYGSTKPSSEQWSKEISLVERLLIYEHKPGFNSSSISSMPDSDLRHSCA